MLDFNQFINEAKGDDLDTGVKNDILELVKKTINSEDVSLIKDFIKTYIKNPEETNIDGLINDSDIYEFYLKNQTVVDKLLVDDEWFNITPSDKNVFSVYDYIIVSTKNAIKILVNELNKDLESK